MLKFLPALMVACSLMGCAHSHALTPVPDSLAASPSPLASDLTSPLDASGLAGEGASPAPSASSSPSPSPDHGDWRAGDVIAFEAPQQPGASERDIFIYQDRLDTVFAMTAANSPADESSPKLSSDRKWLAFIRTSTGPDQVPRSDLMLLDTVAQHLNTLPNLNTFASDASDPDLSGDGRWIAYVAVRGDVSRLSLYDVTTGAHHELPGADRGFGEVRNPRLFAKDRRIAFSASAAAPDGQAGTLDIYIYDLPTSTLLRPPFVNSPSDEDNPDVSDDGSRMLFDSDRFGNRDLFEANLTTGVTHNLSFANTRQFDEHSPRYYGKDDAWIRYKLTVAPSADPSGFLLRIYHPKEALVDTVDIANRLFEHP